MFVVWLINLGKHKAARINVQHITKMHSCTRFSDSCFNYKENSVYSFGNIKENKTIRNIIPQGNCITLADLFPIIFGSALTKQRIFKVLETAVDVYKNRTRIIPTSQLNTYMLDIISQTPPPSNKGKFVKIKYVTMLKESIIPTFVFFCNLPQWVKEPYRRFLENKIRENWDFSGTPISIFMREK